jgi:hypothetical protein
MTKYFAAQSSAFRRINFGQAICNPPPPPPPKKTGYWRNVINTALKSLRMSSRLKSPWEDNSRQIKNRPSTRSPVPVIRRTSAKSGCHVSARITEHIADTRAANQLSAAVQHCSSETQHRLRDKSTHSRQPNLPSQHNQRCNWNNCTPAQFQPWRWIQINQRMASPASPPPPRHSSIRPHLTKQPPNLYFLTICPGLGKLLLNTWSLTSFYRLLSQWTWSPKLLSPLHTKQPSTLFITSFFSSINCSLPTAELPARLFRQSYPNTPFTTYRMLYIMLP